MRNIRGEVDPTCTLKARHRKCNDGPRCHDVPCNEGSAARVQITGFSRYLGHLPKSGSRTLKWDGGKKARYCLGNVGFFSGDLSDNGIQNCSLLRLCILYWTSCCQWNFSWWNVRKKGGGKIFKSFEMKSCWPEPASYYLKDAFNLKGLLKGLTYKLNQ